MTNKKLIGIIGSALLGFALGFVTSEYLNKTPLKFPITTYPGDWEGEIDDKIIYLKRNNRMTTLEIIDVFDNGRTALITGYRDYDNDGIVNQYHSPIYRVTKSGKNITLEYQQTYNNYLNKIIEIKSK